MVLVANHQPIFKTLFCKNFDRVNIVEKVDDISLLPKTYLYAVTNPSDIYLDTSRKVPLCTRFNSIGSPAAALLAAS